jgi:hypothetical protein
VAGAVCCAAPDCAGSGATFPDCQGGRCCELAIDPHSVCSATLPCCGGRHAPAWAVGAASILGRPAPPTWPVAAARATARGNAFDAEAYPPR